jgi:hypothetical protein
LPVFGNVRKSTRQVKINPQVAAQSIFFVVKPVIKFHKIGTFQLDPIGAITFAYFGNNADHVSPRRWARGTKPTTKGIAMRSA